MGVDRTGERRERKDVQRNLERVLWAAHELFAERGAAVTMEEVARRAGVGVGTVYRRFPSKEHLFLAIKATVCADTHRCMQEAAQTEPDAASRLGTLVRVCYLRMEQQAALLELQPEPPAGSTYERNADQQFYATLHRMVHDIIAEGQRAGTLGRGDPRLLAALCLEMLNPRAYLHLQRMIGGTAEELADYVTQFLLHGLRASRERAR